LPGDILHEVRVRHSQLDPDRAAHELVRRVITRLIEDVIAQTSERLAVVAPRSAADVRHASAPLAAFSPAMAEAERGVKDFLWHRMYRHPRVERIMGEAEGVVSDLAARYASSPRDLPPEWAHEIEACDGEGRSRRLADFIAGMTDRYALIEHARLFPVTP